MSEERDKRLEGLAHPTASSVLDAAAIVALCVCENAATPRPDCACVTCTVKRAEAENEALRAERDRLREALEGTVEVLEAFRTMTLADMRGDHERGMVRFNSKAFTERLVFAQRALAGESRAEEMKRG